MKLFISKLFFFALMMFSVTVKADTAIFPNKPIRVIVPTLSGGPSDLCMRAVAQAMQARLGQPLIVENVTGATGNIGLTRAASAAPDGYTIVVPSSAQTANMVSHPQSSFDIANGLKPIGKICNAAQTLVVSPTLAINTVEDLIKYGKANPGKLTFGSIGIGSGHHFVGEMFAAATGIKMLHVPFRGEPAAAIEIASGRVQMMFMAGAKPFIDGHLVVPLATTNKETWPPLPNLPPMSKFLPGFTYNGWNSLMAPAGTPDAVVQRLSQALAEALKDEKVRSTILSLGNMPGAGTPEELANQVRSDLIMLKRVVDEQHLTFPE